MGGCGGGVHVAEAFGSGGSRGPEQAFEHGSHGPESAHFLHECQKDSPAVLESDSLSGGLRTAGKDTSTPCPRLSSDRRALESSAL
eukprot:scaffold66309_cov14-Prasinocladus_malaysianus.AAC.1